MVEKKGKILVLGLGNTIVSDDGVGIYVAGKYGESSRNAGGRVEVTCTSKSGVELLPLLEGYESAVVVDAIKTAGGRPGTVYTFEMDDLSATLHTVSPHSVNVFTAVELGKACGLDMPGRVLVLAVEIEDNVNFGEKCTPGVDAAVPDAVKMLDKLVESLI